MQLFLTCFCFGCVCVSELCNTWFPCCCEMEIFFVQLCEMFKGINSKQTSGFWVFLCPPLCPSSGSRWGMLQGIQNWGTVEWIDLASSNTTAIWGAPWHVPSLTAKYCFSGSFWIVVGFFFFQFCCYVVVCSECRAHMAQAAWLCCRKPAEDLLARYSTALPKLTLDRRAPSIVVSQILVSLGGGFVCLAAGQRSLSHSVSKTVTPTGEQGHVVWQVRVSTGFGSSSCCRSAAVVGCFGVMKRQKISKY